MPEAKAKVRARHEEAIREFQRWLDANPRAKPARRIQMFDTLVDGIQPAKGKRAKLRTSR